MRLLARGRSHVPPALQQLPTSGTGWKNELAGGCNDIISCFPAALLRRDIRTASLALALAPVKALGPTDTWRLHPPSHVCVGDADPGSEEREGLPQKERPPKGEGPRRGRGQQRGEGPPSLSQFSKQTLRVTWVGGGGDSTHFHTPEALNQNKELPCFPERSGDRAPVGGGSKVVDKNCSAAPKLDPLSTTAAGGGA